MKETIKGIGLILLLAAVMLGWSVAVRFWDAERKPAYFYKYIIPDTLTVGTRLIVTSIDTVPPSEESGGMIRVRLAAP